MSRGPFAGLWNAARSQISMIGASRVRRQQCSTAETIEIQQLAILSRRLTQDTTYRPHSPHSVHPSLVDKLKHTLHTLSRYTSGWRFGVINCTIWTSLVFLLNLVVMIWGCVYNQSQGNVLVEGDCERVRKLNSGIHFVINFLGTIILSSSNYCMQCLCAPTRKEVDAAHEERVWLDIGVPNNLTRISRRRTLLWLLLGLSSLPLHLFYNSAIYTSVFSNDYVTLSVGESFINNEIDFSNIGNSGRDRTTMLDLGVTKLMHEKARNNTLERLTNEQCIREYAKMIQSKRRNLLLVASDEKYLKTDDSINIETINRGARVYATRFSKASGISNPNWAASVYDWICTDEHFSHTGCTTSDVNTILDAPESWKVSGYYYHSPHKRLYSGDNYTYWNSDGTPAFNVDYCLSEKADPHCKLQFELSIGILVTVLNFFKAALMLCTVFGTKEEPLMTIGDAAASFLERRDPSTEKMCLLSAYEVKKGEVYHLVGPQRWRKTRNRWMHATSPRRRFGTIIAFAIALIIVGLLYDYGLRSLPSTQSRSLSSLANLGFGAIDPRTIIQPYPSQPTTVIGNILIANIAQLILSFLYFSYNGLFTCMLLGYEWSTYAYCKKGLRVSRAPTGAQRSTYFLQLPYRFALPLMALSSVLHWLVSQSVFLVCVNFYLSDGSKSGYSYGSGPDWVSCGYSPIAIFAVIVLGVFMVVAIILFGFVPYKPGINLAGSCSIAISAACHLDDKNEPDGGIAAREKLQWGVVGTNADGVGHCTFSTKRVEFPKVDALYA